MSYLYLLLNLGSLSIPLIFSFHPRLKFYKKWKAIFIGILVGMCIFIPWDIIFTINGIWGFNSSYFMGITFLSLPIEEWLFFICIPYACVFTHYALLFYFPNMMLPKSYTRMISYSILSILAILSIYYYNKWYTLCNFTLAIFILLLVTRNNMQLLRSFYLTFLVMLIPFFIVNGVLTGSFIENEVVWYNNSENINMRLFSIPIEDTVYAFTLILLNLFVMNHIQKRFNNPKN
ncbi:lycopene cyclase domain-containing protein [Aestuariivivens sediminis]|uniref:lycopene cyclase domain-containing protein n=1 Tax=Aestuariivivens sediminis TaxID=2913557 RepID=UPI001F5AFCF8|nr:lycopene cyclase domain-containing protein [Aestuariivivens sediminis]